MNQCKHSFVISDCYTHFAEVALFRKSKWKPGPEFHYSLILGRMLRASSRALHLKLPVLDITGHILCLIRKVGSDFSLPPSLTGSFSHTLATFHLDIYCLDVHTVCPWKRVCVCVLCCVPDYKRGFGGQYGVQVERQDQCALGYEHKESLAKHESQKGTWRPHFSPPHSMSQLLY